LLRKNYSTDKHNAEHSLRSLIDKTEENVKENPEKGNHNE